MPDHNETRELSANRPAREVVMFTSRTDVTWTVREIAAVAVPSPLLSMLGEGGRGTWLLFLSDIGEERYLTPVPPGWTQLSRFELENWCRRAKGVSPA